MPLVALKFHVRVGKQEPAATGTEPLKKEPSAAIDYVTTLGISPQGAAPQPHPTPDPPRRRSSDHRPFACNHILKALFDQTISDGAAALAPDERARCLLLAEQCCPVASERGDVVDALAHIRPADWASVVGTAGRIVAPSFSGKQLGSALRSVAQVHEKERKAFADLCAPWLTAGLPSDVLVRHIADLAAVQPAGARQLMRDTLNLMREAHIFSKKAQ